MHIGQTGERAARTHPTRLVCSSRGLCSETGNCEFERLHEMRGLL